MGGRMIIPTTLCDICFNKGEITLASYDYKEDSTHVCEKHRNWLCSKRSKQKVAKIEDFTPYKYPGNVVPEE
jgi:hypothetical protein